MNLIDHALFGNSWLWFHILGGGLGARILKLDGSLSPLVIVLIILSIAVIWEIGELILDDIPKTYGAYARFFADSVADILGAFIMAVIVVS